MRPASAVWAAAIASAVCCSREPRPPEFAARAEPQPPPSSSQLPAASRARAPSPAEACVEAARLCGQYAIAGDAPGAVDCMPKSVIDASGGRDALIAMMRRGQQEMARGGAAIVRAEIRPPDRVVQAGDHLYAILHQTTVVRVPEGELHQPSYLLGVARKSDRSWKFVDGVKLNPSLVQRLFPDYPADLPLPEVPEPTLMPSQR